MERTLDRADPLVCDSAWLEGARTKGLCGVEGVLWPCRDPILALRDMAGELLCMRRRDVDVGTGAGWGRGGVGLACAQRPAEGSAPKSGAEGRRRLLLLKLMSVIDAVRRMESSLDMGVL